MIDKLKVNPGLHRSFALDRFSLREQRIISRLAKEWYLTSSGGWITMGTSEFKYFLMKPTTVFSEMFNIERELIVVLSPYPNFEPRSLDAFDKAQTMLPDLRVESVCRVLVSEDPKVEGKITSLLKTDPEQPVVVPFTYDELDDNYGNYFIRNRFRSHFYTRDLFSFLSPLKKDLYFFGRSELLHEIVNRHRSGEHTGLFGLRKSGKTSIIFAIQRHLTIQNEKFIALDCESPSIHMLRWNELLQRIVEEYRKVKQAKITIVYEGRYSEKKAADSFAEDMEKVYRSKKAAPVLILFDEIERISPGTGSSEHWRSGEDFVYFWQAMRGFYQRTTSILTYMLVGTNPKCIEQSMVAGHENPLFSSIPCQYVPPFTVEQTRQMVCKLGTYMGLQFDEILYGKLTEDFGGHPFLIRQFCSELNRIATGDRPVTIDKPLYRAAKRDFAVTAASYLQMIVSVLKEWYEDEYDMLLMLAQGDDDSFKGFATNNAAYTKHLIGYGLISQSEYGYSFNIEMLKEALEKEVKYEKLNLSDDEKVSEISERRNRIEKGLRILIRDILRSHYGRKKAGTVVVSAIPESRRHGLGSEDIDILLARDASPLFLLDLTNIISKNWSSFEHVFEMDKNKVVLMLQEINDSGRPDAHAKYVQKDDFIQLRLYFKKIEAFLDAWKA